MNIQKLGGGWVLIYSFIPVLIGWLNDSAEQGLISAAAAATIITVLQFVIRMVDIQRTGGSPYLDDGEEIEGTIKPAGAPHPNRKQRPTLWRIIAGD